MNRDAFDNMVGIIDEAVELAECAIKAAEAASVKPTSPEVVLVKVASARYQKVAETLIDTGTFRGNTAESLAKTLEKAGAAEFLEILEKLASRAVFPLDAEMVLGGDLVEKSGKALANEARREGESDTALWARCCDEAGLDVSRGA